jgi:hypothetical protein
VPPSKIFPSDFLDYSLEGLPMSYGLKISFKYPASFEKISKNDLHPLSPILFLDPLTPPDTRYFLGFSVAEDERLYQSFRQKYDDDKYFFDYLLEPMKTFTTILDLKKLELNGSPGVIFSTKETFHETRKSISYPPNALPKSRIQQRIP